MEEAKKIQTLVCDQDRISQLPEDILSHILQRLDDLKSAVKTSVLSKSWRYVWCTDPRLIFFQDDTMSLSILDTILQTYLDRNHPLEHFALFTSEDNLDTDNTALLTNKWVPILVQHMGLESLDICVMSLTAPPLQLPSSLIFQSPNIKDLNLLRCTFTSTANVRVDLNRLLMLYLYDVSLPEEVMDSILSDCPSLEVVSLSDCKGFRGIKLMDNNMKNLKAFSFSGNDDDHDVSVEIGDRIRSIETIELERCLLSVISKPFEFARLRKLTLREVKLLSSRLFSCNLHSLEKLELDRCKGIKELKLSSQSMKRLIINNVGTPFKATIDAPSMVEFVYEGILPQSISLGSKELRKSKIKLESSPYDDHGHSHCFNELYGLLDPLRQSEISLSLDQIEIRRLWRQLDNGSRNINPVVVEHLKIMWPEENMHPSAAPFLNRLFSMFRPSFIYIGTYMLTNPKSQHLEMAELLFNGRETAQSEFWQRVLEGVGLQVKYRNQSEWQPIEYTSFTDSREVGEYRVQLKWRE